MKLEIALIRHGQQHGRGAGLIGVTDKPLDKAGEELVREKSEKGVYPEAEIVFSSGLVRCMETARIIYPSVPAVVMKGLRAPDYGDFDGKLLSELAGNEAYTQWASSSAVKACPNGEESFGIKSRSVAAFREIASEMAGKGLRRASIISHRMVFYAILQRFQVPRSNCAMCEIAYGCGCILTYDTELASVKVVREF